MMRVRGAESPHEPFDTTIWYVPGRLARLAGTTTVACVALATVAESWTRPEGPVRKNWPPVRRFPDNVRLTLALTAVNVEGEEEDRDGHCGCCGGAICMLTPLGGQFWRNRMNCAVPELVSRLAGMVTLPWFGGVMVAFNETGEEEPGGRNRAWSPD